MNDHDKNYDHRLQKLLPSSPRTYNNTRENTYPHLQLNLNQIKANAFSLQSYLGRVIHVHLGLFLSPEDYEEVSPGTSYKRPLMSTPMHITINTTIHKKNAYNNSSR